MEDGDDDFGDLYADVEVEASSAMNVAPQISQLQFVSDGTGKQNSDKDDRARDGVDDDVDDEDEDDDLNIVLNSDDDSLRHGEGFTILRNNTNLRSRELEDEDDDAFGTEEFLGGKAVSNSNLQHKYLRSQLAACGSDLKGSGCGAAAYLSSEDDRYGQRMGSRSMGPQSGQRFSLPRSRNIVDVNIDIFEHKPWKHPGADITDYFNFGFNEDSWKLYCNQVDEYRHRGHVSIGTPASEPVQIMETTAFEDGFEHEIVSCGEWGKSESRQRKGQAIQVEGSIFERQSSMDVRRQMDRDSDVIQITILDPEEHCSGSAKEGSNHLESSVPEAFNHGDVSGNDGTDHISFSSASEDESVEGNHLEMESDAPKRSSNRRTSCKPVRRGSKNHEVYQISDGSGGPDEAIRNSYNTKERTGEDPCTTDPSMLVAESSEAEKSPANHRKAFENGACIDRRRSSSLERRPSTLSYRQSVKADHRHSEDYKRSDDERELGENRYHARHANPIYNNKNNRYSKCKQYDENDDKRKSGEHRYHARCNSPVYNSTTRKDFKPNPHHENDDICSRRAADKRKPGDYRYHRRHSSPLYNRGTCRVPKFEAHHEYDYSFLMSDIEGTYERWHGFNPCHEEKVLYLKESELPSDYYNEKFYGDEHGDTLPRDLRCEGYARFTEKMDRSVFRSAEEEEYYGERRRYTEDDKTMARDWFHDESEDVENVDFFSNHEFGCQNSRYPPYLNFKKGAQWKRKGDNLRFRNKNEDDYFLEREYSDGIQGEKIRSITYNDSERDDFECRHVEHVAYTRWEFRGSGRNRWRSGSPSAELNNHLPKRDDLSFASLSSEESYINNGRWCGNMMPKYGLYGRHGTYKEQCTERFRYDGSLGGYSEPFDREDYAVDINDRVDMGRARHHWQSEMQWKEDETMLRHKDGKLCAERASFPFKKASRRKRSVSEREPDDVVESIDDPHVEGREYNKFKGISNVIHGGSHEWRFMGGVDTLHSHLVDGSDHAEGCKYKHTKEVINGNKCSKTSGGSRKQPSLSCRRSLDSHLVVRDGKSSEKHGKAERIDFDSCSSDKGARSRAVKMKAAIDEGLDMGEGQILAKVNMKDDSGAHAHVNVNEKGKTVVDNPRILEAMAKMEKRRARFNDDPVTTANVKNSDSMTKLMVSDSIHETASTRPARKRRWGGI